MDELIEQLKSITDLIDQSKEMPGVGSPTGFPKRYQPIQQKRNLCKYRIMKKTNLYESSFYIRRTWTTFSGTVTKMDHVGPYGEDQNTLRHCSESTTWIALFLQLSRSPVGNGWMASPPSLIRCSVEEPAQSTTDPPLGGPILATTQKTEWKFSHRTAPPPSASSSHC